MANHHIELILVPGQQHSSETELDATDGEAIAMKQPESEGADHIDEGGCGCGTCS